MTMELICWDTWLMGWEKLRLSWRKEAMAPRVIPPTPLIPRAPPMTAMSTYCRLPRLALMGMRMLANTLAAVAWRHSSSLRRVEVRLGGLLMAENLDHLLAVDHFLDIAVDVAQGFLLLDEEAAAAPADEAGDQQHHPTHSSTSAVSTRLENSMAKKTVTMVTMEENTWGMLWEIICRKVSVSLV